MGPRIVVFVAVIVVIVVVVFVVYAFADVFVVIVNDFLSGFVFGVGNQEVSLTALFRCVLASL